MAAFAMAPSPADAAEACVPAHDSHSEIILQENTVSSAVVLLQDRGTATGCMACDCKVFVQLSCATACTAVQSHRLVATPSNLSQAM
jgi:hypothetical protein